MNDEYIDLTPTADFTFEVVDVDGQTAVVEGSYEDGASLPELLGLFKRFLWAAGYTYVDSVVVVKDNGEEASSS